MEKEFVPYQQALDLKELGFDESCFGYFRDGKFSGVNKWDRKDFELHTISLSDITNITNEIILASLYSQAFRWFREKGMNFCINSDTINMKGEYRDYYFYISKGGKQLYSLDHRDGFDTYEEAELKCLKKLIEIVKNK